MHLVALTYNPDILQQILDLLDKGGIIVIDCDDIYGRYRTFAGLNICRWVYHQKGWGALATTCKLFRKVCNSWWYPKNYSLKDKLCVMKKMEDDWNVGIARAEEIQEDKLYSGPDCPLSYYNTNKYYYPGTRINSSVTVK